MGRFLIFLLCVPNFFAMCCLGNVMEIINPPEEHRVIREDIERPHFYDSDEKAMDDLYSALDDYEQPYNFEKPDFKRHLVDALNRIKYIDNNDKNRHLSYLKQHKNEIGNVDPYNSENDFNIPNRNIKYYKISKYSSLPQKDIIVKHENIMLKSHAKNNRLNLENNIKNDNIAHAKVIDTKNVRPAEKNTEVKFDFDLKHKRELTETDHENKEDISTENLKNIVVEESLLKGHKDHKVNLKIKGKDASLANENEVDEETEMKVSKDEDNDEEISTTKIPKQSTRPHKYHGSDKKDSTKTYSSEKFRKRRKDEKVEGGEIKISLHSNDNLLNDITSPINTSQVNNIQINKISDHILTNISNPSNFSNPIVNNMNSINYTNMISNVSGIQNNGKTSINNGDKFVISNPINAIPATAVNMNHNSTDKPIPGVVTITATKLSKGRVQYDEPESCANDGELGCASATEGKLCQTEQNSTAKCLVFSTTKRNNISDEMKIAKQINEFVKSLLVHASKTGNMRKELGLCKTYDKEYTSVKNNNNNVEDEIMRSMVKCLNKILSGTIKPSPCGEMPPELMQFLDWLLLNGVSARDEFKQLVTAGPNQRKLFLFSKSENSSNNDVSKPGAQVGIELKVNQVEKNAANISTKPSLYKNIKSTILGGLSPYLRYNDNPNYNKMYPFNNLLSHDNKLPLELNNKDSFFDNKLNTPFDQDLYKPYDHAFIENENADWGKNNRFMDDINENNPYDDETYLKPKLDYSQYYVNGKPLYQGLSNDNDETQFETPLIGNADVDRLDE